MKVEKGVVAVPVGPMGEVFAVSGLSENGGKMEAVGAKGMEPVVGWDFLGGKVEIEEDPMGAIVREVKEESGGRLVVCEDRLQRVVPENLRVTQLREDELVQFLVTVFILRLTEFEVEGMNVVDNINTLRPRDRGIIQEAGRV